MKSKNEEEEINDIIKTLTTSVKVANNVGQIYIMLNHIIQMQYCQNKILCKILNSESIDTSLLEEIKNELDIVNNTVNNINVEVTDIHEWLQPGPVDPIECPVCEE